MKNGLVKKLGGLAENKMIHRFNKLINYLINYLKNIL